MNQKKNLRHFTWFSREMIFIGIFGWESCCYYNCMNRSTFQEGHSHFYFISLWINAVDVISGRDGWIEREKERTKWGKKNCHHHRIFFFIYLISLQPKNFDNSQSWAKLISNKSNLFFIYFYFCISTSKKRFFRANEICLRWVLFLRNWIATFYNEFYWI